MPRASALARAAAILFAAATLLPTGADAGVLLRLEEEGPWLAVDKELHFAGSLALAASIRAAGRGRGEAIGGSLSLGIVKEVYDATLKPRRPRGVSRKDLVVDLFGALAGTFLLEALDR